MNKRPDRACLRNLSMRVWHTLNKEDLQGEGVRQGGGGGVGRELGDGAGWSTGYIEGLSPNSSFNEISFQTYPLA